MMRLLYNIEDLAFVAGPTHLAIGVFDGIHLGHQAVIGRALRNARQSGGSAVVVTFDPHPVQVLRPEKAPRLLMAPEQKRRLLEDLGVSALLTIAFTREFSKTSAELFIEKLHRAANELREICVGEDWRFGANRSGEAVLLQSLVQRHGIELNAVSPVRINDQAVSSTRVRAAVDRGDLKEAALLLGRPFALWSTVTAVNSPFSLFRLAEATPNSNNNQLPPDGMYAVRGSQDGKEYRGVANVNRLTQEERERFVQLRISGVNARFASAELELTLLQYLRPKISTPGFTEHIAQDALWAKEIQDMESRTEDNVDFCDLAF
jgi:riboflavin kinase/FMN adenylyltransferase